MLLSLFILDSSPLINTVYCALSYCVITISLRQYTEVVSFIMKESCDVDGFCGLRIDAVPQRLPINAYENTSYKKIKIDNLLNEFTKEDYKSAFFLLMDIVGLKDFLTLTKNDKSFLKDAFIKLYYKHFNKDSFLIELLGTLKMYKKLQLLGTCWHVYESQENKFHYIERIWKILYLLCEELTDDDFEGLKQCVPSSCKDQILSSEDWFCWALQNEIFSKGDLSNLELIFNNYPECLNIIKSYKDFESYEIKTPTALFPCGFALIFNYETFDENSGLDKRESSCKDVESLVKVWENFGFRTDVHPNLTCLETQDVIDKYSKMNHSEYDAFICCILSHGLSKAVYSRDGVPMPIPDLFTPLLNNCATLNEKPKLFFIQACQGTNIPQEFGRYIEQIKIDTSNPSVTQFPLSSEHPMLRDVLIVNSSIDGYVSFRSEEGSWFIQTLCKIMLLHGDKFSIDQVMIKVNEEVNKFSADLVESGLRNAIQIPQSTSTLKKKLILKRKTD